MFGPLISKYLLNNGHRVTVVLLPDSELAKRTEEQEKARLAAAKAAMGNDEVGVKSCNCMVLPLVFCHIVLRLWSVYGVDHAG